jgi:signal transduction histidine kinase
MKAVEGHPAEFGAAPFSAAATEHSFQREDGDFPLVIATMPASQRQREVAISVVVLLVLAAAVIAPFATVQAARVDAFIPVLQTVLCAADVITATLLFSQYSIQPQRALLVLASGYIFSGSFAFLQTLAFPGAYAPAGLIGDEFNTPGWLFVLWNTTFPLAILIYALSKNAHPAAALAARSTSATIGFTVAFVLVAIAGLTWIVAAKPDYLPALYVADDRLQTRFATLVNIALGLWCATALVVLSVRKRTVLDLWLIVTLLAWMPNFLVAAIASSVRFSIGWYAARCFVLIGSCMLLAVLLTETTFLYSRLASSLILQRRERTNRLLSVDAITAAIAHELRTPLSAIALNISTALLELKSNSPALEEIRDILTDIETDTHRTAAIISSMRELSKRNTDSSASANVEDVARLVLGLMRHDLQINEVSVTTEFRGNLPEVHLDGTQLQQVLVNLVKNAIEAMMSVAPEKRHLRLATNFNDSIVILSVHDSGPGVPAEYRKGIFDPFFTTKSGGMGLGLSICSFFLEKHRGRLQLIKSDSNGSIFEIAIPVSG